VGTPEAGIMDRVYERLIANFTLPRPNDHP
jgi:hypothetical protein